ncbi:MAG: DsbA family oxidoreductase [Acidimicrobiales bacterium]
MPEVLSIDVWSDVVCPFCYLGSRQLTEALKRFEHRDEVIVRQRAFELDPSTPASSTMPLDELVAKKYGIPVERSRELHHRLEEQARSYDMTWSFATAKRANSFDAHRLIALASTQDFGETMSQRLFAAYFSDGLLINDHDVLNEFAAQVGVVGAPALWTSDAYVSVVRSDEEEALELGITGVPAMLMDRKFMVLGAQGVAKIENVLARAWERQGV